MTGVPTSLSPQIEDNMTHLLICFVSPWIDPYETLEKNLFIDGLKDILASRLNGQLMNISEVSPMVGIHNIKVGLVKRKARQVS